MDVRGRITYFESKLHEACTRGWVQDGMLMETVTAHMSGSDSGLQDDAQLLSLAESVGNMGHWYWHIQSNVVTWSDQVYRIFGCDPESHTPTFESFLAAIHNDDRSRVSNQFGHASKNDESFELDARILTPAGATRNIIAKGQPETDSAGTVVAVFGVITDVTDAFKTLQAIRDQKEMLDLAARVSNLGLWVWDPDQSCLAFCSEQLGRMFDVDQAHLLNHVNNPAAFSEFIHEDDRQTYSDTVSDGIADAKSYEIEYRKSSGQETRCYREIGEPLTDEKGALTRYIATVQDVTDTKRREAELEKARQELEVLVDAKDQLFSIIGHDLKSPFNNIMGFASLLSSPTISLSPEKVQEYAALILEAAENTTALLDTLLAWAAVESADLPYRPIDISLAESLNASLQPLATLAREKGVHIDSAIDDHKVKADRDMVLTIFRNVINNAIKFCESGDKITVSAILYEEQINYILITVADTGVGMDPEKISAFINGRRMQTTAGTSGETGSGLGLRICHNLVKRHGGTLWADSDPGNGCSVFFTLPRA